MSEVTQRYSSPQAVIQAFLGGVNNQGIDTVVELFRQEKAILAPTIMSKVDRDSYVRQYFSEFLNAAVTATARVQRTTYAPGLVVFEGPWTIKKNGQTTKARYMMAVGWNNRTRSWDIVSLNSSDGKRVVVPQGRYAPSGQRLRYSRGNIEVSGGIFIVDGKPCRGTIVSVSGVRRATMFSSLPKSDTIRNLQPKKPKSSPGGGEVVLQQLAA